MNNKFKFVIPSYNNAAWVEYNILSVLNQSYTNWEVLYIDDASTDNTLDKVKELVQDDKRFKLVKRNENKGATYNYFFELDEYITSENDIIIHLDGDDWLIDNDVLDNLNNFYNDNDVWMTYGKFYCFRGNENVELGYPQSTAYSDFVIENKLFRQDIWRASHLRTYRTFLFNKIDKNDLYSKIDGKLFWHATDLAFQYAYLEMCPKDKIGVVDFPTCVYNQSPKNSERTAEREHIDNSKFEIEIRNKKKYKTGLSGEKLPQINVIDYPLDYNYIPKDFSFVYGQYNGEFDITLITDFSILEYIKGNIKINKGKVVADLHETPLYNSHMQETYKAVYDNADMFDLILTYDKDLLTLPNAEMRLCMWRCLNKNVHTKEWPLLADQSLYKIYPKTKNISCISSNKTFLEGHKNRVNIVNWMLGNAQMNGYNVDMFGIGYNEIVGKIEGLKDYRFSIAIENGYMENWATEKLSDCFLTGTVPIYYGCPNIGEIFDGRGVISFQTKEELVEILKELHNNGEKIYENMLPYIERNFKLCDNWALNMDGVFNKHLKKLL